MQKAPLPGALSREAEAPGVQLDAFLPLVNKLCPSWEGEHGHRCVQRSHLECLKVPMHTYFCLSGHTGELKWAAANCCPFDNMLQIPRHLHATSPGTLQLHRWCQEATQMPEAPLRMEELHGDAGLSRDSGETGCSVSFASRSVSPSLAMLLCSPSQNGFNGGKRGRCLDFCLLPVIAARGSSY